MWPNIPGSLTGGEFREERRNSIGEARPTAPPGLALPPEQVQPNTVEANPSPYGSCWGSVCNTYRGKQQQPSWFESRGPDHGDPSPHGALGGQQLGSPKNAETGLRKPLSAPVCKKMFKIPSRTQTWHVEQDFWKWEKNLQRPGVLTFWQAEWTENPHPEKGGGNLHPHPGRLTVTPLSSLFPGIQWSRASPAISKTRAHILRALQSENSKKERPLLSLGLLSNKGQEPAWEWAGGCLTTG